jgi:adenosylmethionine-8-amino-7-oxononanoate aminotransferase
MRSELSRLASLENVAEVRQCGFIAGIELKDRDSATSGASVAAKVCLAARRHGLLTRPIRNVVVLMPPLCIDQTQLSAAIHAIEVSIKEVCHLQPVAS